MWPFTQARRRLRAVDDATGQVRDEVHSRLDRVEADVADLYDRLRRLTSRLAKRAERDEAAEAPPATGRPSIAQLRAAGRDPFNGR